MSGIICSATLHILFSQHIYTFKSARLRMTFFFICLYFRRENCNIMLCKSSFDFYSIKLCIRPSFILRKTQCPCPVPVIPCLQFTDSRKQNCRSLFTSKTEQHQLFEVGMTRIKGLRRHISATDKIYVYFVNTRSNHRDCCNNIRCTMQRRRER